MSGYFKPSEKEGDTGCRVRRECEGGYWRCNESARRDDGESRAQTAGQNQCDQSEPEAQQTGAVLHVGLNVAVSDERSTSVCRISEQVGGFVSQDFQAKLDEIDADLRCFETLKVARMDEWDMRADQDEIGKVMPTELVGKHSHSRSGRLGVVPSNGIGSASLKHPRKDSSEELKLVSVGRKKQVVDFQNLTVEADV